MMIYVDDRSNDRNTRDRMLNECFSWLGDLFEYSRNFHQKAEEIESVENVQWK